MTHRWTLAVPLAVLVALAAPAVAAAAERVPLRATVLSCDEGSVAFQGSMPARRGAVRLQMRLTLLQRLGDEERHVRVAVPGWDRWESSDPGRPGFLVTKRVEGLAAPASYRARVRFRWVDERGRVLRKAVRTSRACVQPDRRPNLRLLDVLRSDGRWHVVIENTGRSTAPAFLVSARAEAQDERTVRSAGPLVPGSRVTVSLEVPCMVGQVVRFTVDAGADVVESSETDNALERACDG